MATRRQLAGTVTLKINGNIYPGNQIKKREGGEGASTELTPKQQYPRNIAPLSPTSDHQQFSPNKIDTQSRIKVLTLGRTRRGRGATSLWVFLNILIDDKTSAPNVFGSCSFIPRTHFETSLVMGANIVTIVGNPPS